MRRQRRRRLAVEEQAGTEGREEEGEEDSGRRHNLGRKRTVQVLRRKMQLKRIASSARQLVRQATKPAPQPAE